MEAFADPLRVFAAALLGDEYTEGKDKYNPFYGAVPRVVLQRVGEVVRAVSPRIMIRSLYMRSIIKGLLGRTHSIHDVRSRNEVEYIHEQGGVVVGITDDPRGVHGGQRTWLRGVLDWLRGLFWNKLERRIPCDIWVVNDRGEDYECRLLEAILQAHDQRYTLSRS